MCFQLRWKLLELRGSCLLRFNMQSLRRLAVRGLDAIRYPNWLSVQWPFWLVVLANQHNVWEGRRADNVTISLAIMIFQVMPSIVFHKRLLRSNEYCANTVCALFFYDNLWSAHHKRRTYAHLCSWKLPSSLFQNNFFPNSSDEM